MDPEDYWATLTHILKDEVNIFIILGSDDI